MAENVTTRAVARSLGRRRRRERLLKGAGLGAILLAFSMLAILVGSLVSSGHSAFVQTHATLTVFIDYQFDLLIGNLSNFFMQSLGQQIAATAIDHHYAVAGDNEAQIIVVAGILICGRPCLPNR